MKKILLIPLILILCSLVVSAQECTDETWTPDSSTICEGEYFTQISNCGTKRKTINGILIIGTKTCPSDQICQNRECITPTCKETDEGNDEDTQGTTASNVLGWENGFTDQCVVWISKPMSFSPVTSCSGLNCGLIEHYCDADNNPQKDFYDCSFGCEDGACLSAPTCDPACAAEETCDTDSTSLTYLTCISAPSALNCSNIAKCSDYILSGDCNMTDFCQSDRLGDDEFGPDTGCYYYVDEESVGHCDYCGLIGSCGAYPTQTNCDSDACKLGATCLWDQGFCITGVTDQDGNVVSLAGADWSECKSEGYMYLQGDTAGITTDKMPCRVTKKFPFFSPISIILALVLLIGYYLKKRQ